MYIQKEFKFMRNKQSSRTCMPLHKIANKKYIFSFNLIDIKISLPIYLLKFVYNLKFKKFLNFLGIRLRLRSTNVIELALLSV